MTSQTQYNMQQRQARYQLIQRAFYGEITAAEAEAEADRLGIGPLASEPPADDFDPIVADRWSLPMAVSWIAWRSTDKVREAWPAYAAECQDWRYAKRRVGFDGDVHDSYFLEPRRPSTLMWLEMHQILTLDELGSTDAPAAIGVADAKRVLWQSLRRGAIQATATHRQRDERIVIPIEAWDDLEATEDDGREVLRPMKPWRPLGPCFENLLFASAALQRMWPPLVPCPDQPPPLMSARGPGHFPLYRAAHWIATEGGAKDVGWVEHVWRLAYAHLLAQVVDGGLELFGTRAGLRASIEPHELVGCRVILPFEDHAAPALSLGEDLVLFSEPPSDRGQCAVGLGDSLRNIDGPRWCGLTVRREQVLELAPIAMDGWTADVVTYRTGCPGRPTSNHLVIEEAETRWQQGRIQPTLKAEAEGLENWLRTNHPFAAKMTAKTIETHIRQRYRNAKEASKR